MDQETKIIWDFAHAAYEKGTLDRALSLLGGLMPADADMGEIMGDFEDALSLRGMSGFEPLFDEVIVPGLLALDNDEALEGLHALLSLLEDVLGAFSENMGDDPGAALEKARSVAGQISALQPLAKALLPVLIKAALPYMHEYARENAGRMIGTGFNRASEEIIHLNKQDPALLPNIMGQAFSHMDYNRVLGAAKICAQAFQKVRPRIFRPIMGAAFSRVLGRVGKKGKRGRV